VSQHNIAKTVVYASENGFGMVVLPADCVANFVEIARLMGLTHVRLATEPELARLFPRCELGAMPPLRDTVAMPILVDEAVAAEEFIAFNAGTHSNVIHMSFADYRRLVNPLIAAFAIEESVLASA
jgi:Ala-tRNA(Pro) deacylase